MQRICVLFLFLSYCHFSIAAELINLGNDFKRDLAGWQNFNREEQIHLLEKFEAKNSYLYETVIYGKADGDWLARREKKRERFFSELLVLEPKMNLLFEGAAKLVADKEVKFRKLFPDLVDNIPIIFMPSIFSFNGKVTFLPEFHRTGLLIGVDLISYRNDNIDVLFSHEFFHAYHSDQLTDDSVGSTMATPLWFEGFATYVSGLLNPNQADSVLLMDNDLAKACSDPLFVKSIALEYLRLLKSNDDATYTDWFLTSGVSQPTRRGYCLGLQVIREVAKNNNLNDMTRWPELRFAKEVEDTLKTLAGK